MKSKKEILVLLTFLSIFLLSGMLIHDFGKVNQNRNENQEEIPPQIKISGYWDLSGIPISIDDNDPSKNWSYTASHYDWCSGSGTWNDPYKIENVTILGQSLDYAIEISNSNAYFIIRNCSFDTSISLIYVENGSLENNTGSDNSSYNFFLIYSNNNSLSGNIVFSELNGFVLVQSNNNTILGNKVNSSEYGFFMQNSDNNKLIENNVNNCDYGICLDQSDNNTLLGNKLNNNNVGIRIHWNCLSNRLSGNLMNFCGITFYLTLAEITSHIIDNTNLVNNKPVYFYVNEISLGPSNFTDAGQIIIVNCRNSLISGFNVSYSSRGIHLFQCSNNNLTGNIVNNNIEGIFLENSDFNNLTGNIAQNNEDGILLFNSNNNMLSGNFAYNNTNGITLSDCYFNNLSGNIMNLCGIKFICSLAEIITQSIDTTNLVNNKPVYFYKNEIGLGSSNFTNAGQIVLVNCRNSIISGLNLSYSTMGIYLHHSNNNTLSGNTANNNLYGIYLFYSENNTLLGNSVEKDNLGIFMYASHNSTLLGNTANNNTSGILLNWCDKSTLLGNIANSNSNGITLTSSSDVALSQNTANYNKDYGITILSCSDNKIEDNIAYNNWVGMRLQSITNNIIGENSLLDNFWGLHLDHSSHNTLSENTVTDNVYGIILDSCFNNTLLRNNAHNNSRDGITLEYSHNNSISENNANANDMGIYLRDSNNNTLLGNNVSENIEGINVFSSNYNKLSGNIANCIGNGILLSYSKNNILLGNIMNTNGIYLMGALPELASHAIDDTNLFNNKPVYYFANKTGLESSNFTNAGQIILINCNFSLISSLNFSEGFGTILSYCYNNTITNSIFHNNVYGIRIDSTSANNLIFLNNFTNNIRWHARDNGINNKWDNGSIGNYWDNYVGADTNDDGIGEWPYVIPGGVGSRDHFPIWDDGDEEIPEDLESEPAISFGNYFILFTFIATISFIIMEIQKKK